MSATLAEPATAMPSVVRDFTLAELEAGCDYLALGRGPGDSELISLWPSSDANLWWIGTITPKGYAQWSRIPVRRADIATVLHIMRVDASLLSWKSKPCDPLTVNPYAQDGRWPTRSEPTTTPVRQEWVYFIRAGVSGPVKIGTARDPRKRLSGLQTSTAVPLRILGVVVGGRAQERAFHEQFAHLRLRGEWFVPEPELLQFIAKEASPWKP